MQTDPIFMSRRDKVLHEANELISKDRNNQYGDPQKNMELIRKNWEEVLQCKIELWQVTFMLAEMKMARIKSGGYKEDSIVDCIGYLALASELKDKNISKL